MAKIDLWTGAVFGAPCTLYPLVYPSNVIYMSIRPYLPTISRTQIHRRPWPQRTRPPENLCNFFSKNCSNLGGHSSQTGSKF